MSDRRMRTVVWLVCLAVLSCTPLETPGNLAPDSIEPDPGVPADMATALLDVFVDCADWGYGLVCVDDDRGRPIGVRERATGNRPPPGGAQNFENQGFLGRRLLRLVEIDGAPRVVSADPGPFLCRGTCLLRDDTYEIAAGLPLGVGSAVEVRENRAVTLWGRVLAATPPLPLPWQLHEDWLYATGLLAQSTLEVPRDRWDWPLRVAPRPAFVAGDAPTDDDTPLYDPNVAWNRGDVAGYLWMRTHLLSARGCAARSATRDGRSAVSLPAGVAASLLAKSSLDLSRFLIGLFIGLDGLREAPMAGSAIADRSDLDLATLALLIVDTGSAETLTPRLAALSVAQDLDEWHRARAAELLIDVLGARSGARSVLEAACPSNDARDSVSEVGLRLARAPLAQWANVFLPGELSLACFGADDPAVERVVTTRLSEIAVNEDRLGSSAQPRGLPAP